MTEGKAKTMKNVYDIKYEKCLSFIFPIKCGGDGSTVTQIKHDQTAIILYLYYKDTLAEYFKYIDDIPDDIHVCVISSRQDVLNDVRKYLNEKARKNIELILKENRGRDVTALLIAGKEVIQKYQYVCFVHDKKGHGMVTAAETKLWVENMWGNLIGSGSYIDLILEQFERDEKLGVLSPPDPIGDHFCTWYGFGWHGSYEITREVAKGLHLETDIAADKPPITIGTALWFRAISLKKLFEAEWDYKHFDDAKLEDSNYLSYGIERIFAYVAQDAGFDTGEVMTTEYAQKQNNYLRYATGRIFAEMMSFFPLPTVAAVKNYKRSIPRLIEFIRKNKKVYLYGAGNMGRFCLSLLRREGLETEGFIVSGKPDLDKIDAIPVISIVDMDLGADSDVGIVITVVKPEMKMQMIELMSERQFDNYFEFWELED